MCIFPKWHAEGEYWTYHLSSRAFIPRCIDEENQPISAVYYDAINGETLFIERPIAG